MSSEHWVAFRELGHLEENLYNETHYSTEMMWGSPVPSHLEKSHILATPPLIHILTMQCVCECDFCRSARPQACLCVWHSCTCARECVCAFHNLQGSLPSKRMHSFEEKKKRKKKQYAHKHTITVACTHTQASSEVSGDHATYLHSCFKETVYKAVVDGDLARCSRFFGHFLFCFLFFLLRWGMRRRECRHGKQKPRWEKMSRQ